MKDNKADVQQQGLKMGGGGGGQGSELAEVEDMIWQLTPSVCLEILTLRLEVELRSFPRPAGPAGLGCQVPPPSPHVLQGREHARLHLRCSRFISCSVRYTGYFCKHFNSAELTGT